MYRPLRILSTVVLLALLLAPAAGAQTVTFKPHEYTGGGQKTASELGELQVPENRTKPNSPKITLKFVRFKSTAAKPGNPIVYLAGGPGGSGIGSAMGTRFPLFMALREFGDVIAWDQRGTNESGAKMLCDEPYVLAPNGVLTRASTSAMVEVVKKCADKLRASGVDVGAYNTRESAADLEDLRKALGAEKLILWGISYGAHLSAATLRYHPNTVERAIIAGIEGPDDTYKLPSDQQSLLEEIARLAWKDPKIRADVPDLLASIRRVMVELEQRPKSVTLTHPLNNQSMTLGLGKLDLQYAIAQMLFAPDTYYDLPDFIARLERGDWLALALVTAQNRVGTAPSIMSVAMDCASGITAARKAVIAQEAPRTLLGDAINLPFPEICAAVNVADAGDAFRGPVVSNVPVLLISGTLDGRTRPRQAEELRLTLPNAQHLVIEGAGHSDPLFLSSPKILEAMKAFLRGEQIPERYVDAKPFTFVPVRKVATLSDEQLARYAGSYKAAQGTARIVKAGQVLYMIRPNSGPIALRPSSETEFFSDGLRYPVRFTLDAQQRAVAYDLLLTSGQEIHAVREP